MLIYTNESKIALMTRIAKIVSPIGFLLLIGAGILPIMPQFSDVLGRAGWSLAVIYGALLLAIGFLSVGNYLQMRYGSDNTPRPHLLLNDALKGMDIRHRIYHHWLPISHALVTPSGVYAILPLSQNGTLHWDAKSGRFQQVAWNWLIRVVLRRSEAFGKIDKEAQREADQLTKFLKKTCGDSAPTAIPLPVLLSATVQVTDEVKQAPIPIVRLKDLKNYVRKAPRVPTLTPEQLEQIRVAIPKMTEASEG